MNRILFRFVPILAISLLANFARGQTLPSTGPSSLAADATVDDILDALDAAGHDFKDFVAKLKITDTSVSTGDSTSDSGQAKFQRLDDDNARFRVMLDQNTGSDGTTKPEDWQFVFDKGWLTERNAGKKTELRKQVLRPGEHMNLFKLDEGVFPLPIGQSRDDVKSLFDVTKPAPAADDPPNTLHIVLTPRPHTNYAAKYKTVDIWVDRATHLPTRITTMDNHQTTIKQTDLTDIKRNTGLGDGDFTLPPLPATGWDTVEEPMDRQK